MLELPEAFTIAGQVRETVVGKQIGRVLAAQNPHKFAWYHGDPQCYSARLVGGIIDQSSSWGGMVEIKAGNVVVLINDGVGLRYHAPGQPRPTKHQLLIEFMDNSAISASVQMYGGLLCFVDGDYDNEYYRAAKEKPSPLSDQFDRAYFEQLISSADVNKLSAKAFLATDQRIPGLGNGVLQDILWKARIHPKTKVRSLSDESWDILFEAVKSMLPKMAELGGRDTEKDLFRNNGGYQTVMSKSGLDRPCPACGGQVKKESYMGGSIYYCETCQKI